MDRKYKQGPFKLPIAPLDLSHARNRFQSTRLSLDSNFRLEAATLRQKRSHTDKPLTVKIQVL